MAYAKSFNELIVYQKAFEVAMEIYRLSKSFPAEERYSLTSQIRRSAISIPVNIAEGWGRESPKNYLQFLRNSRGSLFELETLILISDDMKYIESEKSNNLHSEIDEIGKMLNSLIKRINNKVIE